MGFYFRATSSNQTRGSYPMWQIDRYQEQRHDQPGTDKSDYCRETGRPLRVVAGKSPSRQLGGSAPLFPDRQRGRIPPPAAGRLSLDRAFHRLPASPGKTDLLMYSARDRSSAREGRWPIVRKSGRWMNLPGRIPITWISVTLFSAWKEPGTYYRAGGSGARSSTMWPISRDGKLFS